MRRWLWLLILVLYMAAGVVDGARHMADPAPPGSNVVGRLAVAFSAGLFWPIDIVARPLLLSR